MPGRVQPEVLPRFRPTFHQLSNKCFDRYFNFSFRESSFGIKVSSFYLQKVDLVRKEKEIVVTILFIVPLPNDHIPKECYFYSQFRSLISRWTLRYFHFTRCIRCICYSKFQEIEGCIDDIYISYRFIVAKMTGTVILTWQLDTDQWSRNRYETRECANTPS